MVKLADAMKLRVKTVLKMLLIVVKNILIFTQRNRLTKLKLLILVKNTQISIQVNKLMKWPHRM